MLEEVLRSGYRRAQVAEQVAVGLKDELQSYFRPQIDRRWPPAARDTTGPAIESGKIQFTVITQNGNVTISVPTPVQTPR